MVTRQPHLFSLLNPINHALTRSDVHRYKVEPYVIAADVYATPPHVRTRWLDMVPAQQDGCNGLAWRASSAAPEGDILHLNPCIRRLGPAMMMVRFRSAQYTLLIENSDRVGRGIVGVTVDGIAVEERPFSLKLLDDGATHMFWCCSVDAPMGLARRCCMEAVEVARISTKPMYYVTRTESGFATSIMRFSARTAIATSPC
jgi:hypothetical protein